MSIFSCLLSMFSKELFFQDISGQLFLNIHLIAIPVGYQYCKTLDSFPECQLKLNWGFYYYFENIWHNLTSGISFNLLPSFKIERAYVRFLLMYLNIYLPPRIRPFIWENLGYQKKKLWWYALISESEATADVFLWVVRNFTKDPFGKAFIHLLVSYQVIMVHRNNSMKQSQPLPSIFWQNNNSPLNAPY